MRNNENRVKTLNEKIFLEQFADNLSDSMDQEYPVEDAENVIHALEKTIDGMNETLPVNSRYALGKYCFFTKIKVPDRYHTHNDINNPGHSIKSLIPGKTRVKITERPQYKERLSVMDK